MQCKLIVAIVDRGKGDKAVDCLRRAGVETAAVALGRGTVDSELTAYLGLGESEKEIVVSAAQGERAPGALDALDRELGFARKGAGVAFTLPIHSVGGQQTLLRLLGGGEVKA